ncbi:hypothetical protein J2Z83_003052 [Virgibacillus natechei]|uniref:DUF2306 domain-containing protein n=1 Tax=Virgibacillus natechei TaxID=1216297 RepID=A0ABS4IKE9_9BACI|nr:DUF2306 domain-containing protein [Virgibacillus natechei]MBP1970916.1 hypothetical protein [Virgibacillus natechei]UZD13298.1 DUF2306 domain-containing protein [Virgibacillus natechei]
MNTLTFLLIIHIIAGSFCLLTGAINFSVKKEKGYHTRIGELYHIGYFVVFITSVWMAIINWSESAYLFYIAVFSYGLALFGYLARKRRWRGWLSMHIGGMAGSYIGIITAVLVVNGADIPLINQIPFLLLWFIPTIIGTPIIFMVSKRYRTYTK